jgi:hypothetical protein
VRLSVALLGFIAGDLRAATATAGWLVTATQVGYALGVLLLVPLGDVLDRRRFVPVMLLTSAAALLLCALAPSIGVLLIALGVLGVTNISGQLLTPLAGDLAGDAHRGRVVGAIGSGTLTGILASRTISGFVAGAAGWRAIFALAAVVAVVLAVMLYRAIPPLAPRTRMPYPRLIASVGAVVMRERAARWTLALAATGFAAFTLRQRNATRTDGHRQRAVLNHGIRRRATVGGRDGGRGRCGGDQQRGREKHNAGPRRRSECSCAKHRLDPFGRPRNQCGIRRRDHRSVDRAFAGRWCPAGGRRYRARSPFAVDIRRLCFAVRGVAGSSSHRHMAGVRSHQDAIHYPPSRRT